MAHPGILHICFVAGTRGHHRVWISLAEMDIELPETELHDFQGVDTLGIGRGLGSKSRCLGQDAPWMKVEIDESQFEMGDSPYYHIDRGFLFKQKERYGIVLLL